MITKTTTLVLGAGASMPLGYPSGEDLRAVVLANLKTVEGDAFQQLANIVGDITLINNFHREFKESGRTSVDAFLEHRPEYNLIGKLAIAQALLPHENREALFQNKQGCWYQFLYSKMSSGFNDFDKNQLSIVTYNYDRSLEAFLFCALKSSYGKTGIEVANKLSKIKFVHLHGSLGALPWQSEKSREYDNQNSDEVAINNAAKEIMIIHEGDESSKEYLEARWLVQHSERVIFLGFGFNENNIARLHVPKGRVGLFASAYGLTQQIMDELSSQHFANLMEFGHPNHESLQFLRSSVTL